MKRYYSIRAVSFDDAHTLIVKLKVTPTSFDQSLFLPPEVMLRNEVIIKVKARDVFFIDHAVLGKTVIHLIEVNGVTFLRSDTNCCPSDMLAAVPAMEG